jgi:hypothetical protein
MNEAKNKQKEGKSEMKTLEISRTHNHKNSATGAFIQLRRGVVALAVGASLAIGSLGFATPADARVPQGQENTDGNAMLCSGLQDIVDGNLAIANDDESTGAEQEEAEETAGKAADDWNKYCRSRFGSIFMRATVVDTTVRVQDMAPTKEGGANNLQAGTSVSRGARLRVR